MSYVTRVLQIMIYESNMFKDNLMWDPQYQSWRLMIAMIPQSKNTPPTFCHVTWKADQYNKWKTLNSPPYTALFKDLRSRNPMTETLHIQLHGSDFAKLPLSAGLRWLIEFPPEWAWFLSWAPGQVPDHFKDQSRIPAQNRPSMPASSSTAASTNSLTTPGSSSVFPMPSQTTQQVAGATSKAPSMASASPAAVDAPTFDTPPQCPAPPVPSQPAACAPPTAKMTSNSPACMSTSAGSASVSLPIPLPQPPMPSWQSTCLQNAIPLEQLHELPAQDVEQNQPAEERSTLPQVVAQQLTPEQQTEHIRDHTWHQSEMEKRRRMAQPRWKSAMEAQEVLLLQQQERVRQIQRSAQTPPTAPRMHTLTTIPEGQNSSAASTDQNVQSAVPASSTSDSQEWNAWCDFQESASSMH